MGNENSSGAAEPMFVLERVFDAPRELVFKCWTEPEHFMKWWGPDTFTTPECRIDLRVGGRMIFCMRSPEGQAFWCAGVYREIDPPAKLVYNDYFCDAEGSPMEPSEYGMPAEWPSSTLTTITFEDQGGRTRMTLAVDVPLRVAKLVMADQGWGQSFRHLEEYLRTL